MTSLVINNSNIQNEKNLSSIKKFKLSTRNYTINFNKQYKIPSIGLIQSFKIINYEEIINSINDLNKNIVPILTVGNYEIIPSELYEHTDKSIISIKELRNHIRNIDFIDSNENKLFNFEHYLFSQQLKSIEFYHSVSNNDLYDCIFTSGLNVYIELKNLNNPNSNLLEI